MESVTLCVGGSFIVNKSGEDTTYGPDLGEGGGFHRLVLDREKSGHCSISGLQALFSYTSLNRTIRLET